MDQAHSSAHAAFFLTLVHFNTDQLWYRDQNRTASIRISRSWSLCMILSLTLALFILLFLPLVHVNTHQLWYRRRQRQKIQSPAYGGHPCFFLSISSRWRHDNKGQGCFRELALELFRLVYSCKEGMGDGYLKFCGCQTALLERRLN